MVHQISRSGQAKGEGPANSKMQDQDRSAMGTHPCGPFDVSTLHPMKPANNDCRERAETTTIEALGKPRMVQNVIPTRVAPAARQRGGEGCGGRCKCDLPGSLQRDKH